MRIDQQLTKTWDPRALPQVNWCEIANALSEHYGPRNFRTSEFDALDGQTGSTPEVHVKSGFLQVRFQLMRSTLKLAQVN
ncbi:MAG TPA: hypothetical protein VI386_05150 [Candidatus Sulfotelmatobacter sp.]